MAHRPVTMDIHNEQPTTGTLQGALVALEPLEMGNECGERSREGEEGQAKADCVAEGQQPATGGRALVEGEGENHRQGGADARGPAEAEGYPE